MEISQQTVCSFLATSQFEHVFFSSISTLSNIDELGHHDDNARMAVTMDNTYQLGEIIFTCMVSFNQSNYAIMKMIYLTCFFSVF